MPSVTPQITPAPIEATPLPMDIIEYQYVDLPSSGIALLEIADCRFAFKSTKVTTERSFRNLKCSDLNSIYTVFGNQHPSQWASIDLTEATVRLACVNVPVSELSWFHISKMESTCEAMEQERQFKRQNAYNACFISTVSTLQNIPELKYTKISSEYNGEHNIIIPLISNIEIIEKVAIKVALENKKSGNSLIDGLCGLAMQDALYARAPRDVR